MNPILEERAKNAASRVKGRSRLKTTQPLEEWLLHLMLYVVKPHFHFLVLGVQEMS